MAAEDRLRDLGYAPVGAARLVAKQLESGVLGDPVALHQDAFGTLDDRAPPECSFESLVFGKAAEDDLDHVLPGAGIVVHDVGEHAELGRLPHERVVCGAENRDDRAGRLLDDRLDELERVADLMSDPDERDVGLKPFGHRSDVGHIDLTGDDLVTERGAQWRHDREPLLALVGDQDAKVPGRVVHGYETTGPLRTFLCSLLDERCIARANLIRDEGFASGSPPIPPRQSSAGFYVILPLRNSLQS